MFGRNAIARLRRPERRSFLAAVNADTRPPGHQTDLQFAILPCLAFGVHSVQSDFEQRALYWTFAGPERFCVYKCSKNKLLQNVLLNKLYNL